MLCSGRHAVFVVAAFFAYDGDTGQIPVAGVVIAGVGGGFWLGVGHARRFSDLSLTGMGVAAWLLAQGKIKLPTWLLTCWVLFGVALYVRTWIGEMGFVFHWL